MPIKICLKCLISFKTRANKRKYCSKHCADASKKGIKPKNLDQLILRSKILKVKVPHGNSHDEYHRLAASKARRGKLGSNWQGGKTAKNKIIRISSEFKMWRESVYARDNWTCQKCKRRGGNLHPHHIMNFSEHESMRFMLSNGITLCQECHNIFHREYGYKSNDNDQLNKYLQYEYK